MIIMLCIRFLYPGFFLYCSEESKGSDNDNLGLMSIKAAEQ